MWAIMVCVGKSPLEDASGLPPAKRTSSPDVVFLTVTEEQSPSLWYRVSIPRSQSAAHPARLPSGSLTARKNGANVMARTDQRGEKIAAATVATTSPAARTRRRRTTARGLRRGTPPQRTR